MNQPSGTASRPTCTRTVESRRSWLVAVAVLMILAGSYGAPLVAAVALKTIAADLGSTRSVPALAISLVSLGSGFGAIGFGWAAERIGYRVITMFGGVVIGAGLVVSMSGGARALIAGHGLLIGVLGSGAINIPLMVYISRWFDRHRGSALALVTSGQYLAGAIWPSLITLGVDHIGWRMTMFWFGVATAAGIAVIALVALVPSPDESKIPAAQPSRTVAAISGMSGSTVFILLFIAGFLCCTPMAMPPAHIVALCSDLGINASQGALMLSVLLGSAFVSRQFWGWLADRIGGLRTVLAASICQAIALSGFIWTQDEAGLFAVAAAFGLGFSGIIPAYVVALRELYSADEAGWRVPVWYFGNLCGMAFGAWLAGYIYDRELSYAPAFMMGVLFNLVHIALMTWLVTHQTFRKLPPTHAMQFA